MIKKIVAGAIVFAALGTSNIVSYANTDNITTVPKNDNTDQKIEQEVKETLEIIDPEKRITTSDKTMALSFKAPKDTKVSIEVYHDTSKEDEEEKYVLSYDPIEVEVGSLKMGWAEVDLKSGLNRIRFIANYKDGTEDSIDRTIKVMEVEEIRELLEKIVGNSTLNTDRQP